MPKVEKSTRRHRRPSGRAASGRRLLAPLVAVALVTGAFAVMSAGIPRLRAPKTAVASSEGVLRVEAPFRAPDMAGRPVAPMPDPDAAAHPSSVLVSPMSPISPVSPVSPVGATGLMSSAATGVSLGVSAAAVLLLLTLFRFRRRPAPACPACGSHKCAHVGQVGACRNGYRCHTCGFLWEPDFSPLGRPSSDSPGA